MNSELQKKCENILVKKGTCWNQYEHSNLAEVGAEGFDDYVLDDLVYSSSNAHERERGVPYIEEEHQMFLVGL